MENNRLKFGYDDTDKSIEIDLYGLVFEINNLDSIEDLENLDKNNSNVIEAQLEKILGQGAIEKINNKRTSDGYKKLDLNIELNILGCIFEAYAKSTTGNVLGRVENIVNDINKNMEKANHTNGFKQTPYRKNYNRNQYRGRRNCRRY